MPEVKDVEIGDTFEIKTYSKLPKYWVRKMKKYMGQNVTIKDIRKNGSYQINEDQDDVPDGWYWTKFNFVCYKKKSKK